MYISFYHLPIQNSDFEYYQGNGGDQHGSDLPDGSVCISSSSIFPSECTDYTCYQRNPSEPDSNILRLPEEIMVPGLPSQAPDELPEFVPIIEDVSIALKFIELLKNASLDNEEESLTTEVLDQIRGPFQEPLTLDNPDERLSLDLFLAVTNASEETYNSVRDGILRRYPDSGILTYYKVKRLVAQLTGIIPIIHDMCVNCCVGYTGPFAALDCCPECGEKRYTTDASNIPRKQFHTFPIAPQLQALWRTPEAADSMGYRVRFTDRILNELQDNGGKRISSFTDFFDGADYLEAAQDGRIGPDDMVLMLSVDGAQLYRHKASECWIWIWIIFDHAPDVRYKKKHVLIGGFMPGKNKPRNTDSYFFPGLHHVAAIQKEGLPIWNEEGGHFSCISGFGNC